MSTNKVSHFNKLRFVSIVTVITIRVSECGRTSKNGRVAEKVGPTGLVGKLLFVGLMLVVGGVETAALVEQWVQA